MAAAEDFVREEFHVGVGRAVDEGSMGTAAEEAEVGDASDLDEVRTQ